MYTSKLFEYIGARRPILAIGPRGDVASDLIIRRGLGVVLNDAELVAEQLRHWIELKEKGRIPQPNPEALAGLSREEQTRSPRGVSAIGPGVGIDLRESCRPRYSVSLPCGRIRSGHSGGANVGESLVPRARGFHSPVRALCLLGRCQHVEAACGYVVTLGFSRRLIAGRLGTGILVANAKTCCASDQLHSALSASRLAVPCLPRRRVEGFRLDADGDKSRLGSTVG